MTTIVVQKKDKIVLCSDSQTTVGWNKQTEKSKGNLQSGKVFQHNEMSIGCAGLVSAISLFRYFTESSKPQSAEYKDMLEYILDFERWANSKVKDFKLEDFHAIIVYEKRVWELCDGYFLKEIDNFGAIGTGTFIALGALYSGATAQKAVEASIEFDLYSGGSVLTVIHK